MRIRSKRSFEGFLRYLVYFGIALMPFERVLDLTPAAGTIFKPYRMVFLLVAFLYLCHSLLKERLIFSQRLFFIILFYVYGIVLACINSCFLEIMDLSFTQNAIILTSFCLILYYVFSIFIISEVETSKCCYIFTMSLCSSVILAYYFLPTYESRNMGFFGNPNAFGFACVFGINFLFSKINVTYKNKTVFFYMVLISFLSVSVVSTLSRGALGCLVVSILLQMLVCIKQVNFSRLFFLLMLVCSGCFFLINAGDSFSRMTLSNTLADGGGGRKYLWIAAVELFQDYPWGVGLGQFRSFCTTYLPMDAGEDFRTLALEVHNQYLSYLVELGVFGFSVYLLFCGFMLRELYRTFLYHHGELSFFLLLTFISMLCMDMTQISYFSPMQWFMFAIAVSSLSWQKVNRKLSLNPSGI